MTKFFRKIRYNLMDKGKTGKYLKYAIGEIILVVIGILIALQINTWSEARKDQKEELIALKDLREEFKSNLNDVDSLIQFKEHHISLWENYLTTVSNRSLSNEERSVIRPRMGSLTYEISNTTLNSLLTTGKIDKIKNDSLRNVLTNWNDMLKFDRMPEQLHTDFVQGEFIDIELKLMPNARLPQLSGIKNFFHSESEIKQMRLKAIDNLEYQNAMEHSYHMLKIQLWAGKGLKAKIEGVIDLLTDEISIREGL